MKLRFFATIFKLRSLIATLIFFNSFSSFGQGTWNLIGSMAQTTTNSNVGIGTNSPNAQLNVQSDQRNPLPPGSSFTDLMHFQSLTILGGSTTNSLLKLTADGKLGISQSNPNSQFHVNVIGSGYNLFEITKTSGTAVHRVYFDAMMRNGMQLGMNPLLQYNDGCILFSDNNLNNNSSMGFVIGPKSSTGGGMRIGASGDVFFTNSNVKISNGSFLINDGFQNQFEIKSNGFVIARQIDVHLNTIPDYVFHAAFNKDSAMEYLKNGNYKFLSIEEVDSFIQKNRHLPGIKSASDYEEIGSINIGELQLQLLQKIEELTLYNIQLQKEIIEIKSQLEKSSSK
jgi:hypothetical protein